MKKTFRKAIAVLLAVLMVAFSVPFSALAGTPDAPDMFGADDYTVTQNRKWWVDDGVDVSLDKLQSTPEYWSYNSGEEYNTAGPWSLDFGGRVENYADAGYEDHRNDWKPVIAATVSSQGSNEEAAAAVSGGTLSAYSKQYYNNYYAQSASKTYEAVKKASNILNPAQLKAGQRIAITVEFAGFDVLQSGQFKGTFNKEYLKPAYYTGALRKADTWKDAVTGSTACIAKGSTLYAAALNFAGANVNVEDGTFYGAVTGNAAVDGDQLTSNYIGATADGTKPFGKYGIASFVYSFEVLQDCDASEVFKFGTGTAGTEFEPYYRDSLADCPNPNLYLITHDDSNRTFACWTNIWTDYAKSSEPETKEYTITFTNAAGTVVDTQTVKEGDTPTVPSTNTAATAPVSDGTGHHSVTSYTWPAVSAATADANYDEVANVTTSDCSYTREVTVQPTYKTEGQAKYTCNICGYSYTEVIEKLVCDHSDTKVVNKADSTLVSTGYTGDTVCNICGETIATGTTIAQLYGTAYYAALKAAQDVDGSKYTEASYAKVTAALEANAQATVETYTEQSAVDAATAALKAAVADLVKAVTVEVTATDLGTATINDENVSTAKVAVNGEVTLVATPAEGAEFVGWKVGNNLVSTDANFTTAVVADTTFVPVFKETVNDTFTVVFVDSYGNVIESKQYNKGDKVVAPTAPALVGYTFTGWSMTDDEIAALQEGATITAKYEKNVAKTFTIKADGATITTADAEAENELTGVLYDTKVTVTKAGAKAWTVNGATVAYGDTYTFFCGSDIDLVAVMDSTETASTKVAIVDTSLIDGSVYRVAFLATRTIAPTDTIVKQGFVYGMDMSAADLVLENVGKTAGSSNKTVKALYMDNGYEQFALNYGISKNNSGHTANAVAFVTVKDAEGNVTTVYSDISTYTYA